MTLNLLLVTDLILVEAKVVFKLSEGFFDAPAQEVGQDDGSGGEGQVVGNEDVNIFIVGIRPFIEDEDDVQRG